MIEKLKTFFGKNEQYWSLIVLFLITLQIVNIGVLNKFIPYWGTALISVAILGIIILYAGIMYLYLRTKYRSYCEKLHQEQKDQVSELENTITELNNQNIELVNSLFENLSFKLDSSIEDLQNKMAQGFDSIFAQIEATSKESLNRTDSFEKDLNTKLENYNRENKNAFKSVEEKITSANIHEEKLIEACADKLSQNIFEHDAKVESFNTELLNKVDAQSDRLKCHISDSVKAINELIVKSVETISDQDTMRADKLTFLLNTSFDDMKQAQNEQNELINRQNGDLVDLIHRSNDTGNVFVVDSLSKAINDINYVTESKSSELLDRLNLMEDNSRNNMEGHKDHLLSRMSELSENEEIVMEGHQKALIGMINSFSAKAVENHTDQTKLYETKHGEIVSLITGKVSDILENISAKAIEERENSNVIAEKIIKEVNDSALSANQHMDLLKRELNNTKASVIDSIEKETLSKYSDTEKTLKEMQGILLQNHEENISAVNKCKDELNIVLTEQKSENNMSFEKILDNIQNASVKIKDYQNTLIKGQSDEIMERFVETDCLISGISDLLFEKLPDIGAKITSLESVVISKICEVLDAEDEDFDSLAKKSDQLSRQILDFSKNMKLKLQSTKEEFIKLYSEDMRKQNECLDDIEDYFEDAEKINKELRNSLSLVSKKEDGIIEELDELQNQLSNLTHLSALLNISAKEKQIYVNDAREVIEQQGVSGKAKGLLEERKVFEKNPNRTEEIKDSETGMTVYNIYKNNRLDKIEMKNGNKKVYECEYNNKGVLEKTKLYDDYGKVITEMKFYEDGQQVKERIERITVNGSTKEVVSKFDRFGNRIK